MAIIVCVFKIKVKTPAVVYMLNLAAADVLFVSLLPFNIAYWFSGNNWNVRDGMCCFVTAAFYCNMYCSILLMTSISVDRVLGCGLHNEGSYLENKEESLAGLLLHLDNINSQLTTSSYIQTDYVQYIDTLNNTTCHDVLDVVDIKNFYMYYFATFSLVFFFLPLVITTICYIGIIRTLSTKDIENSCKKKRVVILAIVVFFAFLICFGPLFIIFVSLITLMTLCILPIFCVLVSVVSALVWILSSITTLLQSIGSVHTVCWAVKS
ncbi:unnamed protein product [Staurois parvus]|uniref:G-protein coupled receptors family 1 profile domain-containing protein n=1 Tax=Staurois parvus TaxID=386267 RepID=A0ABN9BJS7_9NEOB|nr:unnamed protein product [Staurois parvus]